MNRNTESLFSELPRVDIQRSTFDRSSSHKTSFNVGELIPFYVDEVLPGDTFKVTTSAVVRLQTLLTPVMDNMYMDTYFFFVPNRIVWEHWKEFMGENTQSAWIPQTEYSVPRILPPVDTGWNVGTIADYLGIPTGVPGASSASDTMVAPIALPFRAYAKICDEWFRDQNLSDPLNIPYGDSNTRGSNGDNYITDTVLGGKPFKVAKYHDYFTSCLPSPQKGPNVGLTNSYQNDNPVNFGYKGPAWAPVYSRLDKVSIDSLHPRIGSSGFVIGDGYNVSQSLGKATSGNTVVSLESPSFPISFDNLWADISNTNITINDLRMAFQLQKYFEKNARAGTRYREILKEHFGVTTSDARMMIPEYLGGHRFPLSIHQVANQSQGESDFLGDLGAMSNTADVHEDFVRSFEEHGFCIGVACVRYEHSYPQGLERFWTRSRKLDYYYPVFANLGEQGVFKSEIYYANNSAYGGNNIFGYQEAWAEYRYKPSRVSGEMRPGVENSLASWHLADYYADVPSLSDSWIREDTDTVDRVLSVSHNVANQIFCDFYVKNIATRPMPMYSIPGLIDHH